MFGSFAAVSSNVTACRDAVMLQYQLDLASSAVQLSVVDNLLITHYPLLAQTAVFDPGIGSRRALIHPQPLSCQPEPTEEVGCAPLCMQWMHYFQKSHTLTNRPKIFRMEAYDRKPFRRSVSEEL